MKYYTLEELKETMPYRFEKGLRNNDNSAIEAITYCFSMYEPDFEYGFDEKTLITLLLGRISIENTNRLYIGQFKLIEEATINAIEKCDDLCLSENERIEVLQIANEIKAKLPTVQIELDPNAK